MAQDLYGEFKELNESAVDLFPKLGYDAGEVVDVFAEMGISMVSSVLNTIALQEELKAATDQATIFGISSNAPSLDCVRVSIIAHALSILRLKAVSSSVPPIVL
jgi:hypothetical protein